MKPPAQKQIETCLLRMRGLSSSARNMNIVGQSPWKGLSPLQGRNVCRLATIVDAAAVMAQLINRDTCVGVCVWEYSDGFYWENGFDFVSFCSIVGRRELQSFVYWRCDGALKRLQRH